MLGKGKSLRIQAWTAGVQLRNAYSVHFSAAIWVTSLHWACNVWVPPCRSIASISEIHKYMATELLGHRRQAIANHVSHAYSTTSYSLLWKKSFKKLSSRTLKIYYAANQIAPQRIMMFSKQMNYHYRLSYLRTCDKKLLHQHSWCVVWLVTNKILWILST